METNSLVQIILAMISSGLLTALITHFFSVRKIKAEAKASEIKNVQLWKEAYTTLFEDLQQRISDGIESNRQMRKYYNERIERYELRQTELKETIEKLTKSNQQLHRDISKMKKDYPCPDCILKQKP